MLPKQKMLIQDTWAQVVPIADQAAAIFYQRLFEIDPSTRPLFNTTDMAQQRKKLLQILSSRCRASTISARWRRRSRTSAAVTPATACKDAHYNSVGVALLWTLEQGLAPPGRPKPPRPGRRSTGFCPASCASAQQEASAKAAA